MIHFDIDTLKQRLIFLEKKTLEESFWTDNNNNSSVLREMSNIKSKIEKYNNLKSEIYGFGDAILETSNRSNTSNSWNGDCSNFPYSSNPFFKRGGNYSNGSNAGTFAFNNNNGNTNNNYGFRSVLVAL